MRNEKIIFPEDDGADKKVTITLWQSNRGGYYLDEGTARMAGSTHRHCKTCGAMTGIWSTYCDPCKHKEDIAKWQARESIEWDGESLVYSEELDKWFDSESSLLDFLGEDEDLPDDFDPRLRNASPIYARELDNNFFSGQLSDSSDDLPGWLSDLVDTFNKGLENKPPLSYEPGRYKIIWKKNNV